MPNTFTDQRVLSAQELSRMAAAIAGTYVVPSASGGAVSVSSAMTVAVAAITATTGLYVNGTQDTTGYGGGTTVIATADATNPRRDYVWYDGAGAIGNTTGTPAANPVLPDLTAGRIALAEIYVTAGLTTIASGNIIDRRANAAVIPVTLAGSSSAATSTTSLSAVDLVTISSLSISATAFIESQFNLRKTAAAANFTAYGLKINSTVVIEAAAATSSLAWTTSTQEVQDGICGFSITPRRTNYQGGVNSFCQVHTTTTSRVQNGASTSLLANPLPTATITSMAIRAINDTASNAAEITDWKIWTR